MSGIKAKNVMFVQQLGLLPYKTLSENIEFIVNKFKPIKFAGILHDKDVDDSKNLKTTHIHLVMQFKNARSLKNLAKIINETPQQFEKWNGDVNNAYSYLLHQTSSAQNQHQYHAKEVIANFDYVTLIQTISKEVDNKTKLNDATIINNMLDLLYEGEITKEEIETHLTGSQYAKAKLKLDAVYKKRLEILAEKWRNEMRQNNQNVTIIWLSGYSGTGKTRLAKEYAKNYSDDYYFSGSSRDPFQRYEGQSVIILDELRPNMFNYSDLLKMLDPFNDEAMAASRYFDKPLTANVFIVTSPYSPETFYEKLVQNGGVDSYVDSFEQLARRLFIVQKMTKTEMSLAFYDTKLKRFIKDMTTTKKNPYVKSIISKTTQTNEAVKLYHQLTSITKVGDNSCKN